MLSKFLIGQSVSAYTKDNRVFEGNIFKNREGKKIVLAENGKWQLLESLKTIKQVGRKLNEENEQAIDTVISKLSPEKVAEKEAEFEQLAKTVSDAAGFSENDENRQDIEKYAQEKLVGLKAEQDSKVAGNQEAMDKASEELKDVEKTPEEMAQENLEEAFNVNKKRLREHSRQQARRRHFGEDAAFDFVDDDEFDTFGDDSFSFDVDGDGDPGYPNDFTYDAIDDELDTFGEDYGNTDWSLDDLNTSPEEEIDAEVDTEFEDALDDYESQGGDYSDELMIEALAKRFGGNAKKALNETSSIPDAVCHLAEQVKAIRKRNLRG